MFDLCDFNYKWSPWGDISFEEAKNNSFNKCLGSDSVLVNVDVCGQRMASKEREYKLGDENLTFWVEKQDYIKFLYDTREEYNPMGIVFWNSKGEIIPNSSYKYAHIYAENNGGILPDKRENTFMFWIYLSKYWIPIIILALLSYILFTDGWFLSVLLIALLVFLIIMFVRSLMYGDKRDLGTTTFHKYRDNFYKSGIIDEINKMLD